MREGDSIWAYLSRRQELCAVGIARRITQDADRWYVEIDWDGDITARLCKQPIPRTEFAQVPMSTCRANPHAALALDQHLAALRSE